MPRNVAEPTVEVHSHLPSHVTSQMQAFPAIALPASLPVPAVLSVTSFAPALMPDANGDSSCNRDDLDDHTLSGLNIGPTCLSSLTVPLSDAPTFDSFELSSPTLVSMLDFEPELSDGLVDRLSEREFATCDLNSVTDGDHELSEANWELLFDLNMDGPDAADDSAASFIGGLTENKDASSTVSNNGCLSLLFCAHACV